MASNRLSSQAASEPGICDVPETCSRWLWFQVRGRKNAITCFVWINAVSFVCVRRSACMWQIILRTTFVSHWPQIFGCKCVRMTQQEPYQWNCWNTGHVMSRMAASGTPSEACRTSGAMLYHVSVSTAAVITCETCSNSFRSAVGQLVCAVALLAVFQHLRIFMCACPCLLGKRCIS